MRMVESGVSRDLVRSVLPSISKAKETKEKVPKTFEMLCKKINYALKYLAECHGKMHKKRQAWEDPKRQKQEKSSKRAQASARAGEARAFRVGRARL